MSTEAQISANRRNAQRSTGPRTDGGKAVSSRNNLKLGFTGAFGVMPWESQEDFDRLQSELAAEHQPATCTERLLVQGMAQAHWLVQRAILCQQALHNTNGPSLSEEQAPQLALLLRYQGTHQRAFHKCLADLRHMQAARTRAERSQHTEEEARWKREAAEQQRARQEARKDELHDMRTHLLISQNRAQELKNYLLQAQCAKPTPSPARQPIGFESHSDEMLCQLEPQAA